MSSSFYVLIPADPLAELPDNADVLRETLAAMLKTKRARIKDYGKLQFIDCGENFEHIACPECGVGITIEQWHEWMDEDWHGEKGFHLHRHNTPCCSSERTLNDLKYSWPQGFASWIVSAEIDQKSNLTEAEHEGLEEITGFALRAIHQRY